MNIVGHNVKLVYTLCDDKYVTFDTANLVTDRCFI